MCIYIYVYFMRMQPQLPNEHIVITRHKLIFDHSREVTVRSIIYPNLRAHSQHFPTNYNSMLFPSNPPWDSYSHFLILFQDFQGTWGAPDSTSWPGLRSFSTTPGAAAERPVVRFCFFRFGTVQPWLVVEPWKMSWLCLEMGTGWYRYTQQLLFKRRNIVIKQRIIIRVPVIKQTRMIPDHSLGKQREKQIETTNQSSLQECVCNRVHYAQYASCRYFQKDTEVLAVQTHSCDRMSFILNQQCKIHRMRATSALPFKHTINVEGWMRQTHLSNSLSMAVDVQIAGNWMSIPSNIYKYQIIWDGIVWLIPILQMCS